MHNEDSGKKILFVNNIKLDKVDKKKENKTTPHVNTKISAYDRIVQLISKDNQQENQEEETKTKQTHMSV